MDLTPDELLTTTRAVRRRLDLERPVPRAVVEECLEIAFQAPNGENSQPWAWVVVDDPGIRAAMAEVYRAGIGEFSAELNRAHAEGRPGPLERMGMEVPVGDDTARILGSADHLRRRLQDVPVLAVPMLRTRTEGATLFEAASVWGSVLPAAWSFMLALRSRGLGSAWTTAHLLREKDMSELLGVPDGWTQVGLFPVAYTVGTDFRPGRRGSLRDAVAWNRWP